MSDPGSLMRNHSSTIKTLLIGSLIVAFAMSFTSPLWSQNPGTGERSSSSQTATAIRVESITVSQQEFNQRVQRMAQRYKQRMNRMRQRKGSPGGRKGSSSQGPTDEKIQSMAKEQVKRQMVNQLVLEHHAERSDVSVSDQEVEKQWQKIVQRAGSEEKLRQKLQQQSVTEQEIRDEIHKQLKRRKFVDQNTPDPSVSDQEAKNYYENNKRKFGNRSFDQIKDRLKQQLERKKRREARQQFVQKLKKETDISVNI